MGADSAVTTPVRTGGLTMEDSQIREEHLSAAIPHGLFGAYSLVEFGLRSEEVEMSLDTAG
jgi:hypothetical protein